jgi:FlaG/FlaF family flagellin (archaellin)
MAAVYDITIEQGATFRLSLVWKDSSNVPVNLTGYTARMQVRRSYTDTVIQLAMTTESGSITLGGSAGTINVVSAAAATEDIAARAGVYDLELMSSDGVVTRLVEGKVTIKPEVTR